MGRVKQPGSGKAHKSSEEALLAQYALYTEWIRHQDARRWTLLGAYVVTHGLLASAFTSSFATVRMRTTLAAIGVILVPIWWIVVWRNDFYLAEESAMAKQLERELLPGRPDLWWHWEGGNRAETNWRRRRIKSGIIIRIIIILAGIPWAGAAGALLAS